VLTFNFPSGTPLPDNVWTVAFNTTHYGANPIGEGAACFGTSGGCPHDSLNVDDKSYTGPRTPGLTRPERDRPEFHLGWRVL